MGRFHRQRVYHVRGLGASMYSVFQMRNQTPAIIDSAAAQGLSPEFMAARAAANQRYETFLPTFGDQPNTADQPTNTPDLPSDTHECVDCESIDNPISEVGSPSLWRTWGPPAAAALGLLAAVWILTRKRKG